MQFITYVMYMFMAQYNEENHSQMAG